MAVLVFYGGAGVNVITYCCKECRSAGIEALTIDKCCEIHNHDHAKTHNHNHNSSTSNCNHITHAEDVGNEHMHTEGNCCDSEHFKSHIQHCDSSTDDNCSLERIDFDWNTQNMDELKMNISPVIHDLFSSFSTIQLPYICENNTVMPNGPPLVLPRDYLSVLTVLLI